MRISALALIHERLYQSDDYARVPFSEYAAGLAGNTFQATGVSRRQVSLTLDLQSLSLAVGRAIPCGLILNEPITNAPKHTSPASWTWRASRATAFVISFPGRRQLKRRSARRAWNGACSDEPALAFRVENCD